jgi:hypothetical protein
MSGTVVLAVQSVGILAARRGAGRFHRLAFEGVCAGGGLGSYGMRLTVPTAARHVSR